MQEKLLKYVPFKKAFQFLKASKNEMKPQLNKNETKYIQGDPYVSERFFKNGCGIQMSQATPTKFSMLFKHNYGKLF